ncbi:MAG: PASTA domain-containing protein, partial [Chloroflexota bacterium]
PTPPGLEPSAALRRQRHERPAITLPKLPSMRVPALRVPELRSPRSGIRLPSLGGGSSSNGGGGAALGLKVPSISLGADSRRWLLAGLGVAILLLAAYFLPRYFESQGSSGTQAVATSAASTVQAGGNVQSTPGAASPSVPVPTGPALGNLVGMTQTDAQKALDALGLTYVVNQAASATVPAGQVMAQFPSAGARMNSGDNVVLSVSRGAPR